MDRDSKNGLVSWWFISLGTIVAICAVGLLLGLFSEGFANTFHLRGGENFLRRIFAGIWASLIAAALLYNGFRFRRK